MTHRSLPKPAPNACASYFDPNAAPPVDPSTLVITAAQVSAVRVDKSSALYLPKMLAQADPNGDAIYYEACNPTKGCFDGVIRTPVADKPGWVGTYEYRLVPDSAPYQISLQSCVRVDRVLEGKMGIVVHPTRFRDLELHCGPVYVGQNGGNLVYQQQPFPDSVLADKLHAMDAQDAVVDSKLEALFTAAQTYAKQNALNSNQLAGIAATIGQERDSIYPLAKSSLTDQILQVAQRNVEHAGLSLADAIGPHCVTNQQVAQAVQAATGTLTPLPPQSEGATAAAAAAATAQQQQDVEVAVLATQQVIASVGGDPSAQPPVVVLPPVVPGDQPPVVQPPPPDPGPAAPVEQPLIPDPTPDSGSTQPPVSTPDPGAGEGGGTTPTTTSGGGGPSTGAIVGAVIGSVVGAIVVVATIGVIVARRVRIAPLLAGSSGSNASVFEKPIYGDAGGFSNPIMYGEYIQPPAYAYDSEAVLYEPHSETARPYQPLNEPPPKYSVANQGRVVSHLNTGSLKSGSLEIGDVNIASDLHAEAAGVVPGETEFKVDTLSKVGKGIHALAASPEQTFLTQLATLTNDFLSARQAYLALVSDLGAYLQAQ